MRKSRNLDPAITLATYEELEYYRDTEQYDTVLEICQIVSQYSPNDFLAQYHLAVAYSDTEKFAESIKVFDAVLNLPRGKKYNIHEIFLLQSNSYNNIKNYEKAIEYATQALSLINETMDITMLAELHQQLCDSYTGLKNYEQALKSINTALKYDTNVASYFDKKGTLLCKLNKQAESIDYFTRAIELDRDPNYYYKRGNAYSELKQYNKSLADYEKALESFYNAISLNLINSSELNNNGVHLAVVDRYQDVMESFDKATGISPKLATLYCQKGYALYKLGSLEKAMECYIDALGIHPNYDLALERVKELQKS